MMKVEREYTLGIGGITLQLPCFFPSISSIKTNLKPIEYLQVVNALKHSLFLISAYDIYHSSKEDRQNIHDLLKSAIEENRTVLLDSGNYESYWKSDENWHIKGFSEICSSFPFHISFCLDNQNPPSTASEISKDVISSVLRDQEVTSNGTILPIIHGKSELLPGASYQVAKQLAPLMLAIPERALGNGILQRAKKVYDIRSALNKLGYYCPLHLLGTGNPLSIFIYSACGADSFDGLEWCKTTVDYSSGRLAHFHNWDFFSNQSDISRSDLPYYLKVFTHNLSFYENWMESVRIAIQEGKVASFASSYLSAHCVNQLKSLIPEVFFNET